MKILNVFVSIGIAFVLVNLLLVLAVIGSKVASLLHIGVSLNFSIPMWWFYAAVALVYAVIHFGLKVDFVIRKQISTS